MQPFDYVPDVTLVIPSYNEEQFVIAKVRNSLDLDYPAEKLKIIWITDGTTDNTDVLLGKYSEVTVMHENERRGKIHAMNRDEIVNTPLCDFLRCKFNDEPRSHCGKLLNLLPISKPDVLPGKKELPMEACRKAVGAGEGLYWKYESLIKRLESETGSVVGAVGELFAIRT